MTNISAEVLLVEDNPNDAELTLFALAKENLAEKVFVVKDGEEAMNFIFAKGQYESMKKAPQLKLILLDLKLPKLNGFEVLQAIRENEKLNTTPVVILSSSAVDNDIKKAYTIGANSYLVKPINFREHASTITEAVKYWLKFNKTLA